MTPDLQASADDVTHDHPERDRVLIVDFYSVRTQYTTLTRAVFLPDQHGICAGGTW